MFQKLSLSLYTYIHTHIHSSILKFSIQIETNAFNTMVAMITS